MQNKLDYVWLSVCLSVCLFVPSHIHLFYRFYNKILAPSYNFHSSLNAFTLNNSSLSSPFLNILIFSACSHFLSHVLWDFPTTDGCPVPQSYFPSAAILIECMIDNELRASANSRHTMTTKGGLETCSVSPAHRLLGLLNQPMEA
ncbi:hypothetical protein PoB_005401800 [Plakobranchus ocellatus]|uniref:Uncharacterized protein n=1 Tax=Plakobranchus ocellatus TaxID=259542 RepID=A0AAV4C7N4_9GAST|nr:hypothetical protein PoB_005401800 [Plakobranchus ocellatus]